MKIGIIVPQSKLVGGGPRLALELAQELKRQRHQVKIYTFRYSPEQTYYYDLVRGLEIISLPDNISLKPKPIFGIPLPGFSAISVYLNEHRLAKMLARLIDPDTDALNPHGNRLAYLAAHYFKKLRKKVPVVFQMNDLITFEHSRCHTDMFGPTRCSLPKRLLYKTLDAFDRFFYLKSIDEVSVLNFTTRNAAKKHLDRETEVIRSGVDAAHFAYRARTAPTDKTIKLLAHAQFFTHRRFEDAIRAVKIIVDAGYDPYFTISGDSETYRPYREYRDRLSKLAEELGVRNRINFPGKVSEEKLLEEFYGADIFVYPHYMQSWGLVVFEAMATGLPAVVSKESGAHEVLTDGENALLVNAKDPAGIAQAIKTLADNPILYQKISQNAEKFVHQTITWENYARGIIRLIEGVKI